MPDLKSEMHKVINNWNAPVNTPNTPVAPTLRYATLATFNYVRDNPGKTRKEAAAELSKLGVKTGSSTSLISVMVTRGNFREDEYGKLFATQSEYRPLNRYASSVHVPTPQTAAPAPAPQVEATPVWSASAVLDSLSVKQAQAVYLELRAIFGA